jgi:flagellar hook-associated protein 3 FlgL
MRISTAMMAHSVQTYLGRATENMFKIQEQAASGLRINRPSDDPTGAQYAAVLRSAQAEVVQYQRNAEEGTQFLKTTDAALAGIVDMVRSARDSALAGAGNGASREARSALASNIEQISNAIVRVANSDEAGRFIFGGFKTVAPPFAVNAGAVPPVIYSGDSGIMMFQIGRASNVAVNLPGDQVFNMNGEANPAMPDLFSTLNDLKTALLAGDDVAINTATTQLDDHLARLISMRGEVGSRQQGMELAVNQLSAVEFSLKESLSKTEDADLVKVMIDLQQQQNTYQATVNVAAILSRPGLWARLG